MITKNENEKLSRNANRRIIIRIEDDDTIVRIRIEIKQAEKVKNFDKNQKIRNWIKNADKPDKIEYELKKNK